MFRRSLLAVLKPYAFNQILAPGGGYGAPSSRVNWDPRAQRQALTPLRSFSTGNHEDAHPLLTLLPEKLSLVNQPIANLSKLKVKSIIAVPPGHQQPSPPEDSADQPPEGRVSFSKHHDADTTPNTFPPNTRGFFYYHPPLPSRPPISAQIRFRLCASAAEFATGRDLTDPTGTAPWGVPLLDVLRPRHAPFHALLRREGLLAPGLTAAIQRLQHAGPGRTPDTRLFALDDAFVLDLTHHSTAIHFVTPKSDSLFKLRRPWIDRRRHRSTTAEGKRVERVLYTGVIKARFELSTHPQHEKLGPTLVLRVLDVIEPPRCLIPDYDGFVPPPAAGRLHGRMVGDVFVPWAMPLLRKKACKGILTFLEDASELRDGGIQ